MAAFQKEAGSVTSRDFSASGWCGKFDAWAMKAPGSGGPGWYRHDDQRGIATDPYAVYSTANAPAWYAGAKFIQVQYLSASEAIRVRYYVWWDAATQTGLLEFHRGTLVTVTGSFAYEFRGGPETMLLASRVGVSNYWSFIDEWDGVTAFVESAALTGVTSSKAFYETDPGGYLSGYHLMTGYKANLDASGKLYFNLVNTSGTTFRIDIYKNSARTQLVGHTGTFTNTATGAKGITADNSSGLGGTITLDITAVAAINIDCRFLRLDLTSGEGVNFTAGKSYFMYDFSANTARISYFKVEAVAGDQLQIDAIGAFDFAVGTRVGAYPHRFWAESSNYGNGSTGTMGANLPYHAVQGAEYQARSWGTPGFDQIAGLRYYNSIGATAEMSPNQESRYAMTRPVVFEVNQVSGAAGVHRNYGKLKNMMLTGNAGLADWLDGRTLSGNNWLAYHTNGTLTRVNRDWTSLS